MNSRLAAMLSATAVVVFSVQAQALEVGDHAPCVELKTVLTTGETVEQCIRTKAPGTSFALIEFFSTSCGDCSKNLPTLSALSNELSATTTTRLIGIDRDEEALLLYMQMHQDQIRFPVAMDTSRDAKRLYGVKATPTVFVLDSNNTIVYRYDDVLGEEQLNQIRALVATP